MQPDLNSTELAPEYTPALVPDETTVYSDEYPRHHRRRRSREFHARRRRQQIVRRLSFGLLPYGLFLIGLAFLAISFFQYVEQDSIVALFLTSRDSAADLVLHGSGWQDPQETTGPAAETTPQSAYTNEQGTLIVPFFYVGDKFGKLRIPSVDIAVNAYQGDSESEFRKGVGHYTGSMYPGQDGNILIAGHRTSYFRNFEYLKIGDLVYFDTTYGKFTYKVREFKIIQGTDQSVAAPLDHEQLTMYTCYPFSYIGNAPKRFVVICDLVEKKVTL
jgi:LPXTG-site transpeptidase (sortase) family protein